MRQTRMLVVDDEEAFRQVLCGVLLKEGHEVSDTASGAEAMRRIDENNFDLVVCDLRLPDVGGLDVLRHAREEAPDTRFVMITAYGDVRTAVEAVKLGADDYLPKPFLFEDLILRINRLLEHVALERNHAALKEELDARYESQELVGQSRAMARVRELMRKVAPTSSNVLLEGESGTGKEIAARVIHWMSPRRDRRMVCVNCAALPETLMESELFGYTRGAFTGASRDKEGYFQAADEGTLFFDEISEMPMALQGKLLRAIESKEISPVGSATPRKVDVRILSATNVNLAESVQAGRFLAALYYRLNVFHIPIPPLRERKEDIPVLVEHFVRQLSLELKKRITGVDDEAMAHLMACDGPGTVRELENAIERAIILTEGDCIRLSALPLALQMKGRTSNGRPFDLRGFLRQCEREHIATVIALSKQDKVKAAQMLGISLSSLYRKLDLSDPSCEEAGPADASPSRVLTTQPDA